MPATQYCQVWYISGFYTISWKTFLLAWIRKCLIFSYIQLHVYKLLLTQIQPKVECHLSIVAQLVKKLLKILICPLELYNHMIEFISKDLLISKDRLRLLCRRELQFLPKSGNNWNPADLGEVSWKNFLEFSMMPAFTHSLAFTDSCSRASPRSDVPLM